MAGETVVGFAVTFATDPQASTYVAMRVRPSQISSGALAGTPHNDHHSDQTVGTASWDVTALRRWHTGSGCDGRVNPTAGRPQRRVGTWEGER
jgi:hypothetical protein